MKRRNFLGLSGAIALSHVTDRHVFENLLPEGSAGMSGDEKRKVQTIAGYSPEELADLYRSFLFEDFLPFMGRHVTDNELGGFFWNTDRSGNNITKNKRTWYDGRGIWVYSFLYNNLSKESLYLETAGKTVDFVLKIKPEGKALWPASYTREGKELIII